MNLLDTSHQMNLRRDQFVRLPHPAGTTVQCRGGTLWITIDGEPDDIELEPGETFSFHADTPALIGVLGAGAEASVRRREPLRWWRQMLPLKAA